MASLHYNYQRAPAKVVARVQRLERVCDEVGVPLAAAALQFPLGEPAVVSVVPGLNHPDQVRETLELYHTPLPSELWSMLRTQGLIKEGVPVPGEFSP